MVAPVEMDNVQSAVPDADIDKIDTYLQKIIDEKAAEDAKEPDTKSRKTPKHQKSSKKLKEQKTEGSGEKDKQGKHMSSK